MSDSQQEDLKRYEKWLSELIPVDRWLHNHYMTLKPIKKHDKCPECGGEISDNDHNVTALDEDLCMGNELFKVYECSDCQALYRREGDIF